MSIAVRIGMVLLLLQSSAVAITLLTFGGYHAQHLVFESVKFRSFNCSNVHIDHSHRMPLQMKIKTFLKEKQKPAVKRQLVVVTN